MNAVTHSWMSLYSWMSLVAYSDGKETHPWVSHSWMMSLMIHDMRDETHESLWYETSCVSLRWHSYYSWMMWLMIHEWVSSPIVTVTRLIHEWVTHEWSHSRDTSSIGNETHSWMCLITYGSGATSLMSDVTHVTPHLEVTRLIHEWVTHEWCHSLDTSSIGNDTHSWMSLVESIIHEWHRTWSKGNETRDLQWRRSSWISHVTYSDVTHETHEWW